MSQRSVQQLDTGWMVRGSNPGGGKIFCTRSDRIWGTMSTGSFPGVNWPGRGFDHPSHLAPRLRKEYSYKSTPPLGLRRQF
jgi:hypothetical protein